MEHVPVQPTKMNSRCIGHHRRYRRPTNTVVSPSLHMRSDFSRPLRHPRPSTFLVPFQARPRRQIPRIFQPRLVCIRSHGPKKALQLRSAQGSIKKEGTIPIIPPAYLDNLISIQTLPGGGHFLTSSTALQPLPLLLQEVHGLLLLLPCSSRMETNKIPSRVELEDLWTMLRVLTDENHGDTKWSHSSTLSIHLVDIGYSLG